MFLITFLYLIKNVFKISDFKKEQTLGIAVFIECRKPNFKNYLTKKNHQFALSLLAVKINYYFINQAYKLLVKICFLNR